jgi:recombination endonuclease VII
VSTEAKRAQQRAYYQANRERIRAKTKAYYEAHREERIAYAVAYKRGHRNPRPNRVFAECHPDLPHFAKGQCQPCYHRDYYVAKKDNWRREYGYEPGQFDAMFAAQDGKCAICGRAERLFPDHDHSTGLPRELLCHKCNIALGFLGDDPNTIAVAAQYVAAHRRLVAA